VIAPFGLEELRYPPVFLYGQLFLFVSALTYSTRPMLAIVTIYSLRFLHGGVAKANEVCRNFVDFHLYLSALTGFGVLSP
jgi:hypothetical protein